MTDKEKKEAVTFYRKLYLGKPCTDQELKAAERRLKIVRHSFEVLRSDIRDALN